MYIVYTLYLHIAGYIHEFTYVDHFGLADNTTAPVQSSDHDVTNAVLSIPEEFEDKKLETYSLFPADKLVRRIENIGGNQASMLRSIDKNITALKSQLQGKAYIMLVNIMICQKFITEGHKQENQQALEEKMENLEKQFKKIIKQQQADSKNMQTLRMY